MNLVHFHFVFLRGPDVLLSDHAFERVWSGDAVDGNETAFGETRCDTIYSTNHDGANARHYRRLLSVRDKIVRIKKRLPNARSLALIM